MRARAHVSVLSLREKVEDAEGWCSVKSLRTVGLVLAFCLYQDGWCCSVKWWSSGVAGRQFCLLDLVGAGGAAYGSYAVEPCLELGVCWGAEPCVCLKP